MIAAGVDPCACIVIAERQWPDYGWGSEIIGEEARDTFEVRMGRLAYCSFS